MASLSSDGHGKWRVQFGGRAHRHTIWLSNTTPRQARTFRAKVEHLVTAQVAGVDDDLREWLEGLPDAQYDRLVAVGLATARGKTVATLGSFLKEYFSALDVKPGTAIAYGHTRECLITHFGQDKILRQIGPSDADKFRQYLKTAARRQVNIPKLADATINRRVGIARMFFGKAVAWKLITENPFSGVKAGSQKNKTRQFFITRDMANAVLAACPDTQWKLLFALARYGGLRCPSEHLGLHWRDIDFDKGRIRVTSPKTEHHEGKGERVIPMFPELRPLIQDAFDAAPEGSTYVIIKYRDAACNLRTQLQRIIRRAGLEPWPKLWQNLRASRVTELRDEYPGHVVDDWLGHTEDIAKDHYAMVRDVHFDRAVSKVTTNSAPDSARSATQGVKPNATEGNHQARNSENPSELPAECIPLHSATDVLVGAVGFEPTKA